MLLLLELSDCGREYPNYCFEVVSWQLLVAEVGRCFEISDDVGDGGKREGRNKMSISRQAKR